MATESEDMLNELLNTKVEKPEPRDVMTAKELPGFGRMEDSRVKGYRGKVTHPHMPLERSYCSNCGAPFGWVSTESSQMIAAGQVIVFCERCEEDMNKKLGPVPLPLAGDKNTTDFTRTNAIAGDQPKRWLL